MQASAWNRVLRSPCVLKLRFYVLRLKGALDLFLVLVELHPKVMFWNWKKWSYKYKWYLCLLSILNSASTSLHSFLRSRGSTGRTPAFPSGNLSYPSVRDGNYIASRTLVLLYVCAALQVFWLLEQPCNSVMEALPSFQSFMKDVRTFRHSFCMETYGGPTKKPTWLYSGRLIGIHGCCWYIALTSDSILRSLFKVHSLIYIYIYIRNTHEVWSFLFYDPPKKVHDQLDLVFYVFSFLRVDFLSNLITDIPGKAKKKLEIWAISNLALLNFLNMMRKSWSKNIWIRTELPESKEALI